MSYKKEINTEEKSSEWKGCCAQTCPIPPSVSAGGNQSCTFHAFTEYSEFEGITLAVKNNLKHYEYYRKVITWGNEQWKHNLPNLRNYEFCKIKEFEEGMPGQYIERLFNTIRSQVKHEARNGF